MNKNYIALKLEVEIIIWRKLKSYSLKRLGLLNNTKNGVLDWISVPTIPWLPLSYSHPYYANAYDTIDPSEGWTVYHGDYWLGKPIGFVFYSGTQSMAYFSYQQAGILWDYA